MGAEKSLATAGAAWTAWLGDETATASDPRSEALAELVHEMPAKPVARAVREALNASRLARMRWDGSMHSLKAEIQLLQDNAASRTAAEEASKANESIEK